MFSGFFLKKGFLETKRKLPWQHCFLFLLCSLFSCVPVSLAYISDNAHNKCSSGKEISTQPKKGLSSFSHRQGGTVPSMINSSQLQKPI